MSSNVILNRYFNNPKSTTMDITKLTQEDIGRPVVYSPDFGPKLSGVITSFNSHYVFVNYGNESDRGQATYARHLEFMPEICSKCGTDGYCECSND